MQNLSFIDALTDEVLTEMLELISLEYDNFDELFEELLSEELILTEAVDSAQIRKEQRERTERLRAAAKKGTRLRSKQQTAQAAEKVNKGIKGKYDRRPWYKKAFSKLKKWVGKGVQALKDRSKESDSEVVYTTTPVASARRTSNTTTTTAAPKPQEAPKPKTETQKRAETLRAKRQATETKKQSNFKNFIKELGAESDRGQLPAPSDGPRRACWNPESARQRRDAGRMGDIACRLRGARSARAGVSRGRA